MNISLVRCSLCGPLAFTPVETEAVLDVPPGRPSAAHLSTRIWCIWLSAVLGLVTGVTALTSHVVVTSETTRCDCLHLLWREEGGSIFLSHIRTKQCTPCPRCCYVPTPLAITSRPEIYRPWHRYKTVPVSVPHPYGGQMYMKALVG